MIIAYNILLLISIVLALPVIVVHVMTSEKRRKTVFRRLGIQRIVIPPGKNSRPIWLHALSVGEVLACVPLVKGMGTTWPHRPVVVSVSTLTGFETATRLLRADVDSIFYFPYDILWSVRKVIREVNPEFFFLVESDIWPNFLFEMKRRRIPTILVNGRISPRSFAGYKRLSFFARSVFSWISVVCAQSKSDAERFMEIGVDAEKIRITGNLKFDKDVGAVATDEIESLKRRFKIGVESKVLLAGSTHEGEEDVLIEVFLRLKENIDTLVLVVVPRDPRRAPAIRRTFLSSVRGVALASALERTTSSSPSQVIVVDAMGMLQQLYAFSDVAFVGGSLVACGGHNPLEPAALGRPVLFGPHVTDFQSIAEMLVAAGGALQVRNGEDLYRESLRLLEDPSRAREMGANGLQVFQANRGAVARTLQISEAFLNR